MLRRQKVRRSLTEWARANSFEPARHHRLLIEKLEAVTRGEIDRLAIFLPPGSAKSTYSSVLFPPWFLAQGANRIILACSHSAELAASFGRKCRNSIDSHANELGYALSRDSKAADNWATSHGCEYFCAGVGAGLSGRRADLGLIDDPIGKKEDAESKLVRDKQWDWWEFDFLPRLKPNAPIVLIQTRWHEDDLAGRLLAKEPGRWTVIRIPMFAEENDPLGRSPGEPLWPEWFTQQQFDDARKSAALDSLYQGRPAPEQGDLIQKDWLLTYEDPSKIPSDLRIYVASDHACTKKEENDRSCLIPFGIDHHGIIWILPDVWWKHAETGDMVEAMLDIGKRRRPINWWAESDHIHKAIGPFLREKMQQRSIWFPITPLVSSKDLVARSSSTRGMLQNLRFRFPAFASWWPEAKHEMLSFPVGKHDDFVAALAEIGRGLDGMSRPSAPPPDDPKLDINAPFAYTLGDLKSMRTQTVTRYGDR